MEVSNVSSPARLTGCLSKLSAVEQHEHAYFAALKEYAVHYAEAQAYLAADEWQTTHDYASLVDALREPDHGLLGDDGEPAAAVPISDDDIDYCGYMGWLRH